jgi:hypothetical protein
MKKIFYSGQISPGAAGHNLGIPQKKVFEQIYERYLNE